MNTRTLLWILVLLIILGLVAAALSLSRRPDNNDEQATTTADTASPLRAEPNVIVVTDQQPGTTIVASLAGFEKDGGFVAIHEDADGQPGAILGTSGLLPAGDNTDVRITLSRAARDGETLHAMLHTDTNGNGVFNAATDAPVQSVLGGPISGWFTIDADASTSTPVTI